MTIVVLANADEYDALTANTTAVKWIKANANFDFANYSGADAFFILKEDTALHFTKTEKPVFVNSVSATLTQLLAPQHVYRINGWPGFLQRPVWEIAGLENEAIHAIGTAINKKLLMVADEPGLVSAKIIAMIINEAYFALGEGVSTEKEIDIAMKLGTNYPFGPFEWAQKIGLHNILQLLQKLNVNDNRCQPAPLLSAAATPINQ